VLDSEPDVRVCARVGISDNPICTSRSKNFSMRRGGSALDGIVFGRVGARSLAAISGGISQGFRCVYQEAVP
jgi:hypothetical protein